VVTVMTADDDSIVCDSVYFKNILNFNLINYFSTKLLYLLILLRIEYPNYHKTVSIGTIAMNTLIICQETS
jgi:hypothetical protein